MSSLKKCDCCGSPYSANRRENMITGIPIGSNRVEIYSTENSWNRKQLDLSKDCIQDLAICLGLMKEVRND